MFSSKDLFFTPAAGGYTVSKSLRFRSSATAYLNRTFGSPTDNLKWTWSGWVKLGLFPVSGYGRCIFSGGQADSGNNTTGVFLNTSNQLYLNAYSGGASQAKPTTTAVYRDPSAFYHLVCVYDSANATQADRFIFYINGVRQDVTGTLLSPSLASKNNVSGATNRIGMEDWATAAGFDGYMAEVNFIDGDTKLPTAFGAYDTNGVWQPAAYTGSYGNNGFYLKFTDVGATSGSNTGYGKDFAGTNYWTTNNLSSTTGTTYDSMLDSPTNAAGDIGNYAVWNGVSQTAAYPTTFSNGNLQASGSYSIAKSSIQIPTTGKWYFEVLLSSTQYPQVGLAKASAIGQGSNTGFYGSYYSGTSYFVFYDSGNTNTGNISGFVSAANDVALVCVDATNNKVWMGRSRSGTVTWLGGGDPSAGTSPTFSASGGGGVYSTGFNISDGYFAAATNGGGTDVWIANFGAGSGFTNTPPSGYSALNTQNLTTPTITNGAQYMAAMTYIGDGTTPRSLTMSSSNTGNNPNGTTFQPDFVWIKDRTTAYSHMLFDVVRGAGSTKDLSSNDTGAEGQFGATYGYVSAFNSAGFSVTKGTDPAYIVNASSDAFVAWQWKEGVSQGFDIVSYAGDNTSNRNISHNLGVAPAFVWVKSLSTGSFYIYHQNLTGSTYFLKCNSTDGTNAQTNTNTPWGTGNWSSTQFMVTNNATNNLNASSTNYIGYLWAAIAGYSAFGLYTGNGLADGPFVYTGFRPRFILLKRSSGVENWQIYDTSRDTYNVAGLQLLPNTSGAESDGRPILDILSNGFKLRNSTGGGNAAADYIYAAFAENPFKISRAR